MGKYDSLLKDQLRQLCSDRGLPVSGTNSELVERLERCDAAEEAERAHVTEAAFDEDDDLLKAAGMGVGGATGPSDGHAPAGTTPKPPEAPEGATEPVVDTSPSDQNTPAEVVPAQESPRSVRYEFECGDSFDDGLHFLYIRQTRERALADGYAPRGGAYRVAFVGAGAGRRAVYEILLRRR